MLKDSNKIDWGVVKVHTLVLMYEKSKFYTICNNGTITGFGYEE